MGVTAMARGQQGGVTPVNGHDEPGEVAVGAVESADNVAAEPEADPAQADRKTADGPKAAEQNRWATRPANASGGPKADREKRAFASPKKTPVSRLPADVDTASMIDLKHSLAGGRWPKSGSVRVEQLLNYFPFAYAPPASPADFAPALEMAEAPWAPSHQLVRVGLKAREAAPPVRAAANLVLLIDTSGSMASPNRLPLVKEAARLLLGRLRPDDCVGIVTYAGESRLTLMPTPVAEIRKILNSLDRLEARGLTNGGAGLELAYDLAQAHAARDGVNCVILCTDGDFNVGSTSEAELTQLIDKRAKSDVQLSIFGFGRNGRIDPRLEALAAHGRGGSGYVNTRREAEQVLTAQLNGLFESVAQDVKVEVAFNPASVTSYQLIGYEDREGELHESGSGAPRGATMLPGQTLTALYEVVAADGLEPGADLLKLKVSYRSPQNGRPQRLEFPLRNRPATFAGASMDFRFATAVAAFGMALRSSPEKGTISLDQVEAWGRECLGDDAGGYRSEFLSLVEQARAAQP
jgi:Ca-activated chloride channel family protein